MSTRAVDTSPNPYAGALVNTGAIVHVDHSHRLGGSAVEDLDGGMGTESRITSLMGYQARRAKHWAKIKAKQALIAGNEQSIKNTTYKINNDANGETPKRKQQIQHWKEQLERYREELAALMEEWKSM